MIESKDSTSTRPYLIRAIYEWCTDNGFTPYVSVSVNDSVRVPMEFVKNGEIVLNISYNATSALTIGNDLIEFKGRFGGVAREILVPVQRVLAIYARENGQGMAFPTSIHSDTMHSPIDLAREHKTHALTSVSLVPDSDSDDNDHPRPGGSGKPSLTRVK